MLCTAAILLQVMAASASLSWPLARTKREQALVAEVERLKRDNAKLHSALKKCRDGARVLSMRRGHLCGLPAAYLNHGSSSDDQRADEWPVRCSKARTAGGRDRHGACRSGAPPPADALKSTAMVIPRHIAQTGPPNPAVWAEAFTSSFGSWQRHHPGWTYQFWNDTDVKGAHNNPNMEQFITAHVPWFLPTWRLLDEFVMRLDVARYLWLYVHGGVYADLDVGATRDITPWLRGADVVLPANAEMHAEERGCWKYTRYQHMTGGRCGAHVGNWWLASVAGHPLWLEMLTYVAENAEAVCARKRRYGPSLRHWAILELTGPYGLGRVVLAHLQRQPASRIAFVRLPLPFVKQQKSAGSWHVSPPPPPAPGRRTLDPAAHGNASGPLGSGRGMGRRVRDSSRRSRSSSSSSSSSGRRTVAAKAALPTGDRGPSTTHRPRCPAQPLTPPGGPLLVLVESACASVAQRQAVRQTWGAKLPGHVVFVVNCCTTTAGRQSLPELSLQPPPKRSDVLSPPASMRAQPRHRVGYRWGLAHSNATWILTVADDSFVQPSALLDYLRNLAQTGRALRDNEALGCEACVWTPWHATTSVVTRTLARAAVLATRDDTARSAWQQYRDAAERASKGGRGAGGAGGIFSFARGASLFSSWRGKLSAPVPPRLAAKAGGGGGDTAAVLVQQRGSPRLASRGDCSMRNSSGALVLGHVAGPMVDRRYKHQNLHWCRALLQPSVLTGTLSAPRHLPHTFPHIRLFATNPSVISDDVYLVRLTSYSYCSQHKNMPYLRKHAYERNSLTAVLSKRQDAPLLSFTHSEDARALRVSTTRMWILYNSWNGSSNLNSMMLRRYRWPSLELIAPPIALRLAIARRREKNWSPFVVPPGASRRGGATSRVRFTYQLEPHVVLACRPADGECHVQHNTSARALWAQRVPHSQRGGLRVTLSGGTPCVTLAGVPTCMAHFKAAEPASAVKQAGPKRAGPYMHLWYAISPEPPFEVRSVSHPFRFAPLFNDARDSVQFASGLAISADAARVTVSFGVGDCLAAELHVPSSEVLRMLRGDPDVSIMSSAGNAMAA